jgi:hypothetical protein
VTSDFQAEAMRLVDDRLYLFERQRRGRDERTVRLELTQFFADEILCRVDLDPVDAVQFGFPDSRSSQLRTIDVLVFRIP